MSDITDIEADHNDIAQTARPRVEPVDAQIGSLVAARRVERGMSLSDFAESIGVTYQQAHKYERGQNRIAAGRLMAMARALQCGPAELLPTADDEPIEQVPQARQKLLQTSVRFLSELPDDRIVAVVALARALANEAHVEVAVKEAEPVS